MSIDAFILPYSVIKNFWWSLPLLSAALGAVLGQMCPGARTLAVRGAPVCLLLAVSGALIWRDDFLFIGAVYGLNHILSGALLLIAAAMLGFLVLEDYPWITALCLAYILVSATGGSVLAVVVTKKGGVIHE